MDMVKTPPRWTYVHPNFGRNWSKQVQLGPKVHHVGPKLESMLRPCPIETANLDDVVSICVAAGNRLLAPCPRQKCSWSCACNRQCIHVAPTQPPHSAPSLQTDFAKDSVVGASAMSHTHLSTVSQERFWLQELLLRSLGGLLRNGLRCECDECQGAEFFGGFPNQTRFHRLEIGKWPRKLAEFGNLAGSAIKLPRHTNL